MSDRELRLECLKLAYAERKTKEDILKEAELLFNFIKNNS